MSALGSWVKAAGGVRDFDTLKQIHHMGVNRCGASRTKEMLDAARKELGLEPIAFDNAQTTSGY